MDPPRGQSWLVLEHSVPELQLSCVTDPVLALLECSLEQPGSSLSLNVESPYHYSPFADGQSEVERRQWQI